MEVAECKKLGESRLANIVSRSSFVVPLIAAGLAIFSLAACTGLGTTISGMALGFGQNLVAAANGNFDNSYGSELEKLLLALAYKKLLDEDIPSQQQGYGQAGYGGSNPGGYPQSGSYPNSQNQQGGYNDPYANQQQNQQGGYNDPYANQQQNQQGGYNDPYANQQQNQQGGYNDPYADQQQNQQGGYNDPYADQQQNQQGDYNDPYANQQQNQQGSYNDPYANQQQGGYYQRGAPGTINLDAALLAQARSADGSIGLRPIQDGDVLHDGRGDPASGDKLKIVFSVDCDCFVYIIGIDATGFVTQIFPESIGDMASPVRAGQQYRLPEGGDWWGLDEYQGIEQFYFVVSFRRRDDIERILTSMASQPRGVSRGWQAVTEPAVVPVPRGLIKVQAAPPTEVVSGGSKFEVLPTSFLTTSTDADLVVTRWFRHE